MKTFPIVGSREIAEQTGKDHKNVVRDIKKMLGKAGVAFSDDKEAGLAIMMKNYNGRDVVDEVVMSYEWAQRLIESYSPDARKNAAALLQEVNATETTKEEVKMEIAKPKGALETVDGEEMMSSRDIAELTEKTHGNVVRDIRNMLDGIALDKSVLKDDVLKGFLIREREYQGRTVTDEILLNRKLTDTLLTGYSPAMRYRVVGRWVDLETGKAQPAMLPPRPMNGKEIAEASALMAAVVKDALAMLPGLSPESQYTAMATAINGVSGFKSLPAVVLEERRWEAAELEAEWEVSKITIGKIAKAAGIQEDPELCRKQLGVVPTNGRHHTQPTYTPKGVEVLKPLVMAHKERMEAKAAKKK